jgi:hypothetical protein
MDQFAQLPEYWHRPFNGSAIELQGNPLFKPVNRSSGNTDINQHLKVETILEHGFELMIPVAVNEKNLHIQRAVRKYSGIGFEQRSDLQWFLYLSS